MRFPTSEARVSTVAETRNESMAEKIESTGDAVLQQKHTPIQGLPHLVCKWGPALPIPAPKVAPRYFNPPQGPDSVAFVDSLMGHFLVPGRLMAE